MPELILGASDMQLSTDSEMHNCWGEIFGGFEVEGLNVPHGQFDNASFNDIRFESSDFSHACFDKATLTEVVFYECDLTNVDFSSAELENVSFIGCDMTLVSFETATLKEVSISECIGGINFSDSEIHSGVLYQSDLTGSSLEDTFISELVICKCNLSKVHVNRETRFVDVKITNSDITELALTLTKGNEDVVLHDCIYYPFTDIAKIVIEDKKELSLLPGKGQTTGGVTYYIGHSSKAMLYCSSMDEFRSVL